MSLVISIWLGRIFHFHLGFNMQFVAPCIFLKAKKLNNRNYHINDMLFYPFLVILEWFCIANSCHMLSKVQSNIQKRKHIYFFAIKVFQWCYMFGKKNGADKWMNSLHFWLHRPFRLSFLTTDIQNRINISTFCKKILILKTSNVYTKFTFT